MVVVLDAYVLSRDAENAAVVVKKVIKKVAVREELTLEGRILILHRRKVFVLRREETPRVRDSFRHFLVTES